MNDSKGCGGVMRAAPVGLVANGDTAFELGSSIAALTHGHPSGYLSAGFLALLIEEILAGQSLRNSIRTAKQSLRNEPNHGEVLGAVEKAESTAATAIEGVGQAYLARAGLQRKLSL